MLKKEKGEKGKTTGPRAKNQVKKEKSKTRYPRYEIKF